MKRILYIFSGSLLSGALVYIFTRILGILIEPYYRPSGEDEMTRNFMIFIVTFLVFVIVGGIIGNVIYKKGLTRT
jgi:hypothetical protein